MAHGVGLRLGAGDSSVIFNGSITPDTLRCGAERNATHPM